MLKSFKINNYKNFENELEIDFSKVNGYKFSNDCITDNLIGKMIIYGRNASGKTNLGKAILDLSYTLNPFGTLNDGYLIKNADSKEPLTTFQYTFLFNNHKDTVIYEYKKYNKYLLQSEKLIINDQIIYEYDFDKQLFLIVPNIFNTIILNNYIEQSSFENEKSLPFLSWINANAVIEQDSIFSKIYNFSKKMVLVLNPNSNHYLITNMNMIENNIQDLEHFLNVMGVACNLVVEKLPDGKKNLFFKYNESKVSFFENASSGTLSLFNFYTRFIMQKRDCSLLYFDEFDAFFHYEMSEKILRYLKDEFKDTLIIFTTHNTNLMSNKLMRPDCLFILTSSGRITPLCNATDREIREGHNLQKLYINGEFDED